MGFNPRTQMENAKRRVATHARLIPLHRLRGTAKVASASSKVCRSTIYGGSELAYAPALGIWSECGRFCLVMLPDPASIPQVAGQVFDGTRTELDFPWGECELPGADEVSGSFGNCKVRQPPAEGLCR